MSCPVCYENFSDEESLLMPRKLNCGDIVCNSCVQSEFIDNTFYCPECGADFSGDNIETFSEIILLEESEKISFQELESQLTENNHNQDSSPNMSSNRSSLNRAPCKNPDCAKKAISDGYCLEHSEFAKKFIVETELIANEILTKHDLRYYSLSGKRLKKQEISTSNSPESILEKFKSHQNLDLGEAQDIIISAKSLLSKEPNILKLDAPIVVIGDIHGQFYDLINIFQETSNSLNDDDITYLFLGDYVDRGFYSCEVILYLLSLKIAKPDKVYLIRGNHECASVSGHFGFKEECKRKYGVNIYYSFLLLFQTMPIAALISTAFGDIYACHGGLSPFLDTIDEIEQIDRFVEPEGNSSLMDILWSDPYSDEDLESMTLDEYKDFMEIDWRPNPARGCSYRYGFKSLSNFLDKNNLVCLVRAHEVQEDGFKKHFAPEIIEKKISLFQHSIKSSDQDDIVYKNPNFLFQEDGFPPLITIFSAPNYCNRYQNKGAVLYIDAALDGLRVIQYDNVDNPIPEQSESQTKNLFELILSTCPYMPTSFCNFVKLAVELGEDESLFRSESSEFNGIYEESSQNPNSNEKSADDISLPECVDPIPQDKSLKTTKKRRESKTISLVRQSSIIETIISSPNKDDNESLPDESEVKRVDSIDFTNLDLEPDDSKENIKKTVSQRKSVTFSKNYEDKKNMESFFSPETKKRKSSAYIQALASDSINEVHPERLDQFIQSNFTKKKDLHISLFQISQEEKPAISVADLKDQYEKRISQKHSRDSIERIKAENEKIKDSDRCTKLSSILEKFGGTAKWRISLPRKSSGSKIETREMHCSNDNNINGDLKSSPIEKHCSKDPNEQENESINKVSNLFSQSELMGLRLMFSLFDRSGLYKITYEDLIAYAEETGDLIGIKDADMALEYLDIDGDGCIGLLDFIHFARRLKKIHINSSINR